MAIMNQYQGIFDGNNLSIDHKNIFENHTFKQANFSKDQLS